MGSIRQNRFFVPILMVFALVGTVLFLGLQSAPASAAGCTPQGTREVTLDEVNGETYSMGTFTFYQSLKRSEAYNPCVVTLQKMANVLCTRDTWLDIDGRYGRRTQAAIKSIQASLGLPNNYYQVFVDGSPISVDGNTGPQTWSILQAFKSWGSPYYGGWINCRAML